MRLTDVDALIDDVKYRYCKDCNRRKGIKRGKYRVIYEVGDVPCRACGVGDMLDELDNAPTIDVEPVKHGHWIRMSDADGSYYACSECGESLERKEHYDPQFDLFPRLKSIDKSRYCPHCGAYMGVETK